MNKLKKFYKTNRVYVILMGISAVCLLLILGAFIYYLLTQNNTSEYGNRLNGLETVEIKKDKLEEIKDSIEEYENVEKASVRAQGKIIYINFYLIEPNQEEAKNISIKTLELFDADSLTVYDINFSIDLNDHPEYKEDEVKSFPIMGYKKSDNALISWTKHGE